MTLAKYIRLSSQNDDCCPGEKLESNSVTNQRSLLDHYITSQPDLAGCRVLEFIDDGHTGTNFDCPGVQAMFAAVKRGEVSCMRGNPYPSAIFSLICRRSAPATTR